MTGNAKYIHDLLYKTGKFPYILVNKYVSATVKICDLTAFVSPSIRRRSNECRFDYDVGLTIITNRVEGIKEFQSNIKSENFVILPRVVPVDHSNDMMVEDGSLSEWVVNDMISTLDNYCLSKNNALDLIENGNDRFLRSLKNVYKDSFDELIVSSLRRLI